MLKQKKIKKMKTLKRHIFSLLLVALVLFNNCVEDDDFNTPNTDIVAPIFSENAVFSQISSVAGALAQAQDNNPDAPGLDYSNEEVTNSYAFNDTDQYMIGYVVSSDEGGNYFEELIIQDKAENPTIGVKVLIDVNPLFTRYDVGRKVFVKLNGLAAGITNGVLTLGVLNGNEVDKIPSPSENDFLIRSTELVTMVPLSLDIAEFTDDKTNLFVALDNVQFQSVQVIENSFTYASEAFDEFDGERNLQSCSTGASTIFSTSTFADFKSLILPSGIGSMSAVLSRNFEGDAFVVSVNSPEDVSLTGSDRCGCGLADMVGPNSLFEDSFETQSINSLITGNGWTNFIQEGSEGWEAYTSDDPNASLSISARAGNAASNNASTIAWLITPQIDLDAQSEETLSFMTSNSFSDNSRMSAVLSGDWDGDITSITSATWRPLVGATIVSDNEFFGNWVSSSDVSLDCESGIIHIAFVYRGSGLAAFDGTYELDEIKVKSN
jgi:hypothetical protein